MGDPAALVALRRTARKIVAESNRPDLAELLRADEAAHVAKFWDEHVGRHREPFAHWESPPSIAAAIHEQVSGDPRVSPLQFSRRNMARLGMSQNSVARWGSFSISCSKTIRISRSMPTMFRSHRSGAHAHAGAAERCRFQRIDLNAEALPHDLYDAVLTAGAMQIDPSNSVVMRECVAPFPPPGLMHRTSGLTSDAAFGVHGATILRALAKSSPELLANSRKLLDFGVGAGRLARMFKGFSGRYVGVDVDQDMIDWVKPNLPWVEACRTEPRRSLPFSDGTFDAVVSVSVFTHMNESDQLSYLDELKRGTAPGARLMLTVCGVGVIKRAEQELGLLQMLAVPSDELARSRDPSTR